MPEQDNKRAQPQVAPVAPPTLPPDFPDIPQNPSSELQPPPDPLAAADKVAGTTPASSEPEIQRQLAAPTRRHSTRLLLGYNNRMAGSAAGIAFSFPKPRDPVPGGTSLPRLSTA
jgi:hypothetical protein